MNTRRHAFALAAILTATVLTGAVAAAGIFHRPTGAAPAPVIQIASHPTPQPAARRADD
jgi:hypothetical protein